MKKLEISQIQLLAAIVELGAIAVEKFESDKMIEDAHQLVQKNMLVEHDGHLSATTRGSELIRVATSGMEFKSMIPQMKFITLTSLTHRLFEHFVSSGFHINVILKNLKEDEFEYFVRELEEAIEKRKAKTEKENRDIDDSSQKLSETVEE